jgi:methylmalonyl-CoA mutase C-terminal domain/subunit
VTAPIRVLIGKPGLDGHNRGARVIVQALRDAGMEVIYSLFPRIAEMLRQGGADDVLLFCGGTIPKEDVPALENAGYKGVFGPDTPLEDIVTFVRERAPKR